MLHTTFAKAKEANACIERYKKMGKALGGIARYGKDTPVGLDKVLETCGLQDAVWCFRCTIEPPGNTLIEFTCQCAEHVLHFYEDKYPDDKRPRQAIETARICITDKSNAAADAAYVAAYAAYAAYVAAYAADTADTAYAAYVAYAAAYAAYVAYAAYAAADTAYAAYVAYAAADVAYAAADAAYAAGAAEEEWQKQTLLKLLTNSE